MQSNQNEQSLWPCNVFSCSRELTHTIKLIIDTDKTVPVNYTITQILYQFKKKQTNKPSYTTVQYSFRVEIRSWKSFIYVLGISKVLPYFTIFLLHLETVSPIRYFNVYILYPLFNADLLINLSTNW